MQQKSRILYLKQCHSIHQYLHNLRIFLTGNFWFIKTKGDPRRDISNRLPEDAKAATLTTMPGMLKPEKLHKTESTPGHFRLQFTLMCFQIRSLKGKAFHSETSPAWQALKPLRLLYPIHHRTQRRLRKEDRFQNTRLIRKGPCLQMAKAPHI